MLFTAADLLKKALTLMAFGLWKASIAKFILIGIMEFRVFYVYGM